MISDDNLAVAVGDWVMRNALRQIDAWRQCGIELQVSVNAFARQLIAPGFADRLAALLAEFSQVPARCLIIEVVETAALQELDAVRRVIETCRTMGVDFALDDFGTGYSSLVYLRRLPAREIKIDQSFVRKMLADAEDLAIVEAVIGLGRAFRLTVVAEGAETPAHVARLLELGCDVMQGFALAAAMPPEEVVGWLTRFRSDPAPARATEAASASASSGWTAVRP
jgi:EAL domain-containing protein (putative c-di-GMP-specific phosphodiesterase class I)